MIEFTVPNMTCGHCVSRVTRALKELDPSARVEIDLCMQRVRIQSGETKESLTATLTEVGYPPAQATQQV
jgi:copper chaperone